MRLIPALTALAPFLVKGPAKRPIKNGLMSILSFILIFMGSAFLLASLHTWIEATYGIVPATATIGTLLILAGLIPALSRTLKAKHLPEKTDADFLLKALSAEMRRDPAFQSVLKHIDDHPFTTILGALSLGVVIAHQDYGDPHDPLN